MIKAGLSRNGAFLLERKTIDEIGLSHLANSNRGAGHPLCQLGIRIESKVKKAMERAAKEERHPLALQVEMALKWWLTQRKARITKM